MPGTGENRINLTGSIQPILMLVRSCGDKVQEKEFSISGAIRNSDLSKGAHEISAQHFEDRQAVIGSLTQRHGECPSSRGKSRGNSDIAVLRRKNSQRAVMQHQKVISSVEERPTFIFFYFDRFKGIDAVKGLFFLHFG